jgi:hypothetical protein
MAPSRQQTNTDTEAQVMTITQAQALIDHAVQLGILGHDAAVYRSKMIRRKERYGNTMHWSEQARMRAVYLSDLPKIIEG